MYEDLTPEQIKQEILDDLSELDIDKSEGSFVSDVVAPISYKIWEAYKAIDAAMQTALLNTSDGPYIDARAEEFGITRKPGVKATGVLTFSGADGASIPEGTIVQTVDGVQFATTEDATIADGTIDVPIEAMDDGAQGNVLANSITEMIVNLQGVASVTNQTATTGGVDEETDDDLRDRVLYAAQNPATSGNAAHYKQWALEVPGVGDAKVSPLAYGAGTVGVLIVGPDKMPVDTNVVQAAQAYIDAVRPIGATVTVKTATGVSINVSATVTLQPSTTIDAVEDALEAQIAEYCESLALTGDSVLYNRIGYLLIGIDGVSDYDDLLLNGGTQNIALDDDEVPTLGTVTLT